MAGGWCDVWAEYQGFLETGSFVIPEKAKALLNGLPWLLCPLLFRLPWVLAAWPLEGVSFPDYQSPRNYLSSCDPQPSSAGH